MSELIAYNSERIYWAVEQVEQEAGDIDTLHLDDNLFYIKSEADKEIDFWKKESHDHYERWFSLNAQYEGWFGKVMRCERAERELRHQKYKRCLAKKDECKLRSIRYQDLWEKWRKTEYDTSGSYYKNYIKWWHRAMKWRNLAEKFKTSEVI